MARLHLRKNTGHGDNKYRNDRNGGKASKGGSGFNTASTANIANKDFIASKSVPKNQASSVQSMLSSKRIQKATPVKESTLKLYVISVPFKAALVASRNNMAGPALQPLITNQEGKAVPVTASDSDSVTASATASASTYVSAPVSAAANVESEANKALVDSSAKEFACTHDLFMRNWEKQLANELNLFLCPVDSMPHAERTTYERYLTSFFNFLIHVNDKSPHERIHDINSLNVAGAKLTLNFDRCAVNQLQKHPALTAALVKSIAATPSAKPNLELKPPQVAGATTFIGSSIGNSIIEAEEEEEEEEKLVESQVLYDQTIVGEAVGDEEEEEEEVSSSLQGSGNEYHEIVSNIENRVLKGESLFRGIPIHQQSLRRLCLQSIEAPRGLANINALLDQKRLSKSLYRSCTRS